MSANIDSSSADGFHSGVVVMKWLPKFQITYVLVSERFLLRFRSGC